MNNYSLKNVLKKNTMIVVMFVVYIFFAIMTNGNIFTPSQFSALITQNAYVFVLAVGMLMCMLIKGNIDLSVGAVVCFIDDDRTKHGKYVDGVPVVGGRDDILAKVVTRFSVLCVFLQILT